MPCCYWAARLECTLYGTLVWLCGELDELEELDRSDKHGPFVRSSELRGCGWTVSLVAGLLATHDGLHAPCGIGLSLALLVVLIKLPHELRLLPAQRGLRRVGALAAT